MLKSIKLSNLRNSEFIEFFKTFLQIVTKKDPELLLNIKPKFDTLSALLNKIDAIFKPDLGNKITQELEELDAARDNSLSGLELIIRGYCHHSNNEFKQSAQLLWDSIQNYGVGITRFNYQEETQVIDNFTSRWLNNTEFTNALTTLTLTSWVTETKSLNDSFRTRFVDRLEDEAQQSDVKTIDLRKQITTVFRETTDLIQAYATINAETIYTETLDYSNELIEKYSLLLKNRSANQEETVIE